MKQTLIIANGILPPQKVVENLVASSKFILCADGGANSARRLQIVPDAIIGDMDSIMPATRKFYKNVPMILKEEQDSTDFEKALSYCVKNKLHEVRVVGAVGNRIDHSTGALGCFKKFGSKLRMTLYDEVGLMTQIRRKIILKTRVGETFSLIPLDRCTGVTTRNLKYALRNGVLELGVAEGISNVAEANHVSISVQRGTLLLYRFYALMNFPA
jgi:thiamine pyrophosphokinase